MPSLNSPSLSFRSWLSAAIAAVHSREDDLAAEVLDSLPHIRLVAAERDLDLLLLNAVDVEPESGADVSCSSDRPFFQSDAVPPAAPSHQRSLLLQADGLVADRE